MLSLTPIPARSSFPLFFHRMAAVGWPRLAVCLPTPKKLTLVGARLLIIAFATNTYAGGNPQFITNFTGAVIDDGLDNAPGGGDDFVVLGPELAVACAGVPQCQVFGGSAVLGGGNYYLLITGNAAVDAGYGGNLSTFAAAGNSVARSRVVVR